MKFPKEVTLRDKYGPAIKTVDQEEADAYFKDLVEHSMSAFGKTREEAENVKRQNLGYFAGYYDSEARRRVEKLFTCEHPIFGSIAEKGPPTNEEAFIAGVRSASGLKNSDS